MSAGNSVQIKIKLLFFISIKRYIVVRYQETFGVKSAVLLSPSVLVTKDSCCGKFTCMEVMLGNFNLMVFLLCFSFIHLVLFWQNNTHSVRARICRKFERFATVQHLPQLDLLIKACDRVQAFELKTYLLLHYRKEMYSSCHNEAIKLPIQSTLLFLTVAHLQRTLFYPVNYTQTLT